MEKRIQELIEACSKDPEAAQKIEHLVKQVTEERDEAREHLMLLERAIESDYDSILITGLGMDRPGPEIVYVNEGFTRMTGFRKEEAIGQTPRILQGEKTDPAVLQKLRERLQEGKSFFGHTVNYRKDGSEFINQWDIHPLTNADGEITHWVSYQHDITDRKEREKTFVDTRLEFDDLMEESKKTLIDLDEQGNIVTANILFRQLLGYDPEELKTRKLWELMDEPYIETFRHKFDHFKPGDFDNRTMEAAMVTQKGNKIDVKMETRLIQMPEQRLVRVTFQNRSLQKRIVDLLQRKAKESAVSGSAGATEFRYKLTPRENGSLQLEYLSASYQDVTGGNSEASLERDPLSWVCEEDRTHWQDFMDGVMSGRSLTQQYRLRCADGSDVVVIDYAKPELDEATGEVTSVKGIVSKKIASEP